MEQSDSGLERLEGLIAQTAQAIRTGNLAAMGTLAQQTEASLKDLGEAPDIVRLGALRDAAQRNAVALEAARRGVRAARRRLAEITSAHNGVQTYDHVGKAQNIGGPNGSLKARL